MDGAATRAAGAARGAATQARRAGPWLERGARLGYAARGLVYGTLGLLSLQAATQGGRLTGSRGAVATLGETPGGNVLLALIGVGLLAYAAWRLVEAATGAEGEGSDAKGIGKRVLHAASGLALGSLGVWTLRLLAGGGSGASASGGESTRAEGWTARVLELPLGRALVIVAGLGAIAFGVWQLVMAATDRMPRNVHKHLDLDGVDADGERWIVRLARFGTAARGVVFGIIGGFLVHAAWRFDPSRAAGLDQALGALAGAPFGRVLLGVVALGFVAFGAYQLVNARYRVLRMP